MTKLLYVHGLASSGQSNTVRNLREMLPNVEVNSPDIPLNPNLAFKLLKFLCREEAPDLIIGSSMGGMFAQQLHGFRKILVNPSFHVSEFMSKNIGEQPFLNRRLNGAKTFNISMNLCEKYAALEQKQFYGITECDIENTYAFFGDDDKLVNCKEAYLDYYKHSFIFNGGHRLNSGNIRNIIVPFINKILKLT